MALLFDSIEAQQPLQPSLADLPSSPTAVFALVTGPLFLLPVLLPLLLAAMAVGIRPRGGRWFSLAAQLVAVLVLLISLRGFLEAVAAVTMMLAGVSAELLLFKPPRGGGRIG